MRFQRAYTRALRLMPNYVWWRPLLALVLAVVFHLVFQALAVILPFLYFLAVQRAGVPDVLGTEEAYLAFRDRGAQYPLIIENPTSIYLFTVPIIFMLPSVLLALRVMKLGGLGTLSSVDRRLRWERLGTYLAPAFGLVFAIGFLFPCVQTMVAGSFQDLPGVRVLPASLVAILILIPLQCIAEEYAFRGFVMQVLGSWIPSAWTPILIQTLLFTIGHSHNARGMLIIICMGLVTGILTVRLGGLEAAIALHVANNLLSFLSRSLFVDNAIFTSSGVVTLLLALALDPLYALIALRIAKRRGWLASDPPDLDERLALASGQPGQVADGSSAPSDSGEGLSGRGGAKVGWDVSQPPCSSGMAPQSLTTPPDPLGREDPGNVLDSSAITQDPTPGQSWDDL